MAAAPAYPDGDEVYDLLPEGSNVDPETVQRFVDSAIARVGACHATGTAPVDATTVGLVWDWAYARSLKQHYVQGEGYIETPAADSLIETAQTSIDAYCLRIQSPAVDQPGVPAGGELTAYFGRSPF